MYQYSISDPRGLEEEQIRRIAPSVFAGAAHESRSTRYAYIPTSMVLAGLAQEGFVPTAAMQSQSRIEGKSEFTKHLLRLRHRDDLGMTKPDVLEVVLVNAHDGSSAYKLYHGIFRMVCSNGLIAGDFSDTMSVRHTGNVVDEVIEGTYKLVEEGEKVMGHVEEMKQIELDRPEQLLLAQYTLKARFDLDDSEDGEQKKEVIYEPSDFLRRRRSADVGDDLYTVTNVVQEAAIRGGVKRLDGQGHRHSTRTIHGIDQTVRLNKLVWQFAEELRKFKHSQ